jgi:hypothetical protein
MVASRLLRATPLMALAAAACATVTARPGPYPSRPTADRPANVDHRGPARTLGVPPGHLPPPGSCAIWFPGEPPGHQPAPGDCALLATRVPAGAWLLYRPSVGEDGHGRGRGEGHGHGREEGHGHEHGAGGAAVVRVTVYGDGGPSLVRIFDIATGHLLSEERPEG